MTIGGKPGNHATTGEAVDDESGPRTVTGSGNGANNDELHWDLVVRPRRNTIYASVFALVIVVAFIVFASLLRESYTGVHFRVWDQIAVALIGVLLAVGVLLFTRPRMRVGPAGVTIRNIFSDRLIEWDLIERITFPAGASWARIDLPNDEYVPVLAVPINDRGRSVDAVKAFRRLQAAYAPRTG